jgi:hypothetical protein
MDSVLINAANTFAVADFHFDEAIIAPVLAPRVLYFPVVGVTIGIRVVLSTFSILSCALDPPVFDGALLNFLVLIIFLGVADNRHGVVNAHSIFITIGI